MVGSLQQGGTYRCYRGALFRAGRVRKSSFVSVPAMAPTAKENDISATRPEGSRQPASTAMPPSDTAIKQQPVALEVPVTVNGARAVDGSDKREPFSESTKTVLIFGSGAVIRLSSSVAPGQLLFLTNEKTKKEVVCQVVKSKNYRNVNGYVELEFTESVVGFWGMRFPGDRIGSAPQQVTPAPPVNYSPAQPITPVLIDSPRASEVQASFLEPAKAPAAPVVSTVTNLLALFESKPATPEIDPPPAVQICVDTETETLKKHTARLQEQLSNMMFSEEAKARDTVLVKIPHAPPVAIQKDLADTAAKALEQSKIHTPEPAPAPPARIEPVKLETLSSKSLLDDEELKIPASLEPLARNAGTPSSAQEPVDRE